ncbi:MAG: response regulator [Alphaproteobacteria bacterium]|nr:response regulator [Alphaproteobacteria bacterium]MCB9931714.1 response regulator [Alphaproteobacteria bacterium]
MSELRLLYVDDDPDIREVASLSLSLDQDIVVQTCACGADALVVAAEWQPRIILLDVMMPEMDGPRTLSLLRANERTADIPVIFITARAQTHEIGRFLALGAIGVIVKPFDPMTLAAEVRGYIDRVDIK